MYDLTVERVKQSKQFCDALLATGSKHLVHNMENDSCWGFGEDGEGVNLMGVTLEKARDSLVAGEIQYTQDDPIAPTAPQESQTEELDIIIISDTILAGVNQYMEGTKADLHVLSGATTSKVHQSLENILKNRKHRAVVIHCGTNDLEAKTRSLTVIQETYQHIVSDILFLTGGTTIIMSGMIHRLDKPQLNERMNTINDFLQSLQTETVRYVNHNPPFFNLHRILNQGGLHLRIPGIRQVATNLTLSLAGQSPTANAQAWTTEPWTQGSSQTHKQQHQAWSRSTRPAPPTPKSQTWSGLPLHNRFATLAKSSYAEETSSYLHQICLTTDSPNNSRPFTTRQQEQPRHFTCPPWRQNKNPPRTNRPHWQMQQNMRPDANPSSQRYQQMNEEAGHTGQHLPQSNQDTLHHPQPQQYGQAASSRVIDSGQGTDYTESHAKLCALLKTTLAHLQQQATHSTTDNTRVQSTEQPPLANSMPPLSTLPAQAAAPNQGTIAAPLQQQPNAWMLPVNTSVAPLQDNTAAYTIPTTKG